VNDFALTDLRRGIGYVSRRWAVPAHDGRDNIGSVRASWDVKARIRERAGESARARRARPLGDLRRYPGGSQAGSSSRGRGARDGRRPPIMLMDEPFDDRPDHAGRLPERFLRPIVRSEDRDLFVTHDIDEAIKMGDRIADHAARHLVQWARRMSSWRHLRRLRGQLRGCRPRAQAPGRLDAARPRARADDRRAGTTASVNSSLRDVLS